ncbi:BT_3987 domain-containing protein [Niabella sp. CJ426]|uniref:BT_3987 domain-containing protein n=1 Tax=unclassified Niabella TaxID=2646634 RepID=UPI003CFE64AE
MKKLLYTIQTGIILPVILLTGCLKDKQFDDGTYQPIRDGEKVISLGLNTIAAPPNFAIVAFDNSSNDTIVNLVPVELGGPVSAPEDINVTVEQQNSLVTDYNEEYETDYAVPSAVSIVNPVVTIKKGTRVGFLQVKLKPSTLIGTSSAMGFSIKSVAPSTGYTVTNQGAGVAALLIKNRYDGKYLASGTMTHPSLGGSFTNKEWVIQTTGANTVEFQLNTTALFSVIIKMTINADNSITLASDDVSLVPYVQSKNFYDPATRTFNVDFGYTGDTRHITAKAVYNSPR